MVEQSEAAVNRWNEPGNPLWLRAVLYLAELLGRKKRRGEDWAAIVEDLKILVGKS